MVSVWVLAVMVCCAVVCAGFGATCCWSLAEMERDDRRETGFVELTVGVMVTVSAMQTILGGFVLCDVMLRLPT